MKCSQGIKKECPSLNWKNSKDAQFLESFFTHRAQVRAKLSIQASMEQPVLRKDPLQLNPLTLSHL